METFPSVLGMDPFNAGPQRLQTCARTCACERQDPAGLLSSLVHDEQQVLGLAELPSEPRKRHTGAAWGGDSDPGFSRDGSLATGPAEAAGDTLTAMETAH